jgi:hypothetical protein
MSAVSRIFGVFFEPGKTFEDIAARPTFVAPMILVIVVSLAVVALAGQHVGWERMVRAQMELSSRVQQMPADQKEQAIQFYSRMAPVFAYCGVILGTPLTFLIVAGVALGMVKGIMSAPVTFKQAFAAVSWGWLPHAIGGILTIVVMFLKSPEDFHLQNPLVFNPGAFMEPSTANKFLLSLASSLDLFVLWAIMLIAFGLKAAGGKKLSMGGALTAVLLPWAVYVLGKSALAGLGG